MTKQKTYIAIDLKSFYASVECKERNRDPLTTNLVVADKSRTEKTICLAVSPSLKSYGIPGRPRLFEVVQKVKEANNTRRWKAPNRTFTGSSDDSTELNANPALEIDYIVAPPRMAYYLESVLFFCQMPLHKRAQCILSVNRSLSLLIEFLSWMECLKFQSAVFQMHTLV